MVTATLPHLKKRRHSVFIIAYIAYSRIVTLTVEPLLSESSLVLSRLKTVLLWTELEVTVAHRCALSHLFTFVRATK